MSHWCFEYMNGFFFDDAPISRRLWDFYKRVFNPTLPKWEPAMNDEPIIDFEY